MSAGLRSNVMCQQEQVSGGTTNTVLRNLLSDTQYTVTVAPVYPEGEGLRQSDKGKTRKFPGRSTLYNKVLALARPSMHQPHLYFFLKRKKKKNVCGKIKLAYIIFYESGWSDHARHVGLIFTLPVMLTQQSSCRENAD